MSIKAGPNPPSGVRRTASRDRGRDPPGTAGAVWHPAARSSSVRLQLSADAQRILSGQEVPPRDDPPPLTYARSGRPTRTAEDGRSLRSFTDTARASPRRAEAHREPALTLLHGGRDREDSS